MNFPTPAIRTELYPEIEPLRSGYLELDGRHKMYWEESGNPHGAPVVFLHGGPGAGASPMHRRFFDPAHYRIIIYDQRGAGRSRPHGDLTDNTTPHLVADMEKLRAHLGIEKWVVFGGSWGSTLALAYAQTQPARCAALVLRGIFLCRKIEIDWFLYGMRFVYPEAWHRFAQYIPEAERSNLLAAYSMRLNNPDPSVHMPAAHQWSIYEGSCSTLLPSASTVAHFAEDGVALGLARIEAHYFAHNIFLPENALLDNAWKLRSIPGIIVQGRYDLLCPPKTSHALAKVWPEAEIRIVEGAGHTLYDPGVRDAVMKAIADMASRTTK
jgi:proline iminopeptidase